MFFNESATTEIYTYRHTLSLRDALPSCAMQPDHAAHCVSVPLAGCRGSTSRAAMKFGRGVARPHGARSRFDTALYTRHALASGKCGLLACEPCSSLQSTRMPVPRFPMGRTMQRAWASQDRAALTL